MYTIIFSIIVFILNHCFIFSDFTLILVKCFSYTYTEQNYKRNTFVFAPIFHELN